MTQIKLCNHFLADAHAIGKVQLHRGSKSIGHLLRHTWARHPLGYVLAQHGDSSMCPTMRSKAHKKLPLKES